MYTPTLLHTYRQSKSKLPLPTWISAVAKNLPQFADDASIYNAVPINIKIAGAPSASNGNVSLSVAAFEPNWYNDLVKSLEKMTNRSNIGVVSYLGEPIEGLTPGQLACIGECDIIDLSTKKPVRLASVVAPPLKLATNKTAQLNDWWNGARDDLSREIASSFKGHSMAELANAVVDGGATHQLIRSYLEKHTLHNLSWEDFARTYGKSSFASVDSVASNVLEGVRKALQSNETQVRNFHAISGEASLWKRSGTTPSGKTKDEFTMYRDIVEDAVFHPMIGHAVIHSILYGINKGQSKPRAQHSKGPGPIKKEEEEEEQDVVNASIGHPVTNYYRNYHQQVHGKLPNHYIEALNRSHGLPVSKYPGDAKKVAELFSLYSGRSVIGCGVCHKKKKKQQDDEAPVERKLVPISAAVAAPRRRLVPIDSPIEKKLPPLVPIDAAVILPPLERLDGKRPMPPLVPLGTKMPTLIKMGTEFADDYQPTLDDFL